MELEFELVGDPGDLWRGLVEEGGWYRKSDPASAWRSE